VIADRVDTAVRVEANTALQKRLAGVAIPVIPRVALGGYDGTPTHQDGAGHADPNDEITLDEIERIAI
jgi:hypothetical protein